MEQIDGGRITALQLKAAGIDTVFGVVAGPMIELFAGAQAEGIRVVGCRHEESAAFMASAWGYQRRAPGVVITGSGPGMTNAVTAMHVATESAMPLVVLGGSVGGRQRGLGGFQEADQMAFAAPGCKWTRQVEDTRHIAELLHLAMGRAVSGRPGAVYLDYPGHIVANKIARDEIGLRERKPEISRPHPDPSAVERIAQMLATARRPLIIVGKGAAWADAGSALTALVDRGIPYVTSPMGRGVIADDNEHFMNGARSAALGGADAVVMIGARFNWIFGFGRAPRYRTDVRIAHIDVDATEMYSAADVEIGLVADAAVAARDLGCALEGRKLASADGAWLAELRAHRDRNQAALAAAMAHDGRPINPYRLVGELARVLPRDATLVEDGETIMGIGRVLLPSHRTRARLNAGTTGCMGTGVPYAIGAALAHPEHPTVALLGDYAFGAAAMEVETAVRVGAKVVFVVANNEGIAGHLLQDFMMPKGSPPIASLIGARYEKMMEMVDGHAEYVEEPSSIRPALERALGADGPALVHVRIDPKAHRLSGSNYLE